jgi:hypothetical protein
MTPEEKKVMGEALAFTLTLFAGIAVVFILITSLVIYLSEKVT